MPDIFEGFCYVMAAAMEEDLFSTSVKRLLAFSRLNHTLFAFSKAALPPKEKRMVSTYGCS